jgi:glyoxylase-like metal-dependent hydrolase (beta-lactamase superfamily II)
MITIKQFTFNPFQENTYLLIDEKNNSIIIDPGCYSNSEQQTLKTYIEKNNIIPVSLINTHCHIDHILGNNFVIDTYKVPFIMHNKDLSTLNNTVTYAPAYGFNIEPPYQPTEFIDEGDIIKLGNNQFEVLFVPGHAPGHIVLVNHAQKFIIGGDVLFYGSIGRTDLPGGDHQTLITNIKQKLLTLPNDYEVFPGHGPSTTIGFEKKNNPFLV